MPRREFNVEILHVKPGNVAMFLLAKIVVFVAFQSVSLRQVLDSGGVASQNRFFVFTARARVAKAL